MPSWSDKRLVGRTGIEPVTLGLRVLLPHSSLVSVGYLRLPINASIMRYSESFDCLWFSIPAAKVTANKRQMESLGRRLRDRRQGCSHALGCEQVTGCKGFYRRRSLKASRGF